MQMFGTIKHIVAGKNSLNETFSVFLVEIHKNVLSLLTVPPIEFCKTPRSGNCPINAIRDFANRLVEMKDTEALLYLYQEVLKLSL